MCCPSLPKIKLAGRPLTPALSPSEGERENRPPSRMICPRLFDAILISLWRVLQIQFYQFGLNLREAALHEGAFIGAETVEWLGHKVVANAETGERALDALDD